MKPKMRLILSAFGTMKALKRNDEDFSKNAITALFLIVVLFPVSRLFNIKKSYECISKSVAFLPIMRRSPTTK